MHIKIFTQFSMCLIMYVKLAQCQLFKNLGYDPELWTINDSDTMQTFVYVHCVFFSNLNCSVSKMTLLLIYTVLSSVSKDHSTRVNRSLLSCMAMLTLMGL